MTVAKASHSTESFHSTVEKSADLSSSYRESQTDLVDANLLSDLEPSSVSTGSYALDDDTSGSIEFSPLLPDSFEKKQRTSTAPTTFPAVKGKRAFGFANRMAKATNLENLYQIAVSELKKGLQCDRAMIYRFQSEQEGVVVAESLNDGYTPALDRSLNVLAFGATHAEDYHLQPAVALNNADNDSVSPYQSQLLQQFQVRASLSLPVFLGSRLWGLLVVQQCNRSRQWKDRETAMLYQLGTELTLRLQAYELHQHSQKELTRSSTLARITQNIHQFSHLQQVFDSTTRHLRSFLKAERVMIFRLALKNAHSRQSDRKPGKIISEQISAHIPSITPTVLEESCFDAPLSENDLITSIQSIEDIHTDAHLSQYQIDSLASYQVRASLAAPLLKDGQLWGLLCVHQCTAPRQWEAVEMAFVERVAAQLSLALKQSNYLRQVEEKTNQLKASVEKEQLITKITEKLRSTSDLPKTLRTAVKDIRRMMKADRVGLFRFDPEKKYTVGEYVVEDVATGTLSMLANKLQDHCFAEDQAENYRKGRYWVVDDVTSLDLPDCLVEILEQMQVKASIVVPLLKGDVLWGLFSIHQCQHPRKWQESDVQFAHRIGAQLNLALQQADYLTQVQEKTQKLEASVEKEQLITKITERLRTTTDLSKTLRTTVQDIRRMIGADRVGLFQFDPEKNYTVGEYVVEDVATGTVSMLASKLQDHCFAEDQAENYRKGRYWVVDDVTSLDLPGCLVELLEQMQVKASIAVPLLKGDVLWGLFSIHQCQHPRKWQESDVQFAHRIGAQLNLALQQADYLTQVQEKTQKLEASVEKEQLITKITERLRTTTDLSKTLRTTVQDIRRMMGADRVGLFQFDPEKNYTVGEYVVEDVSTGTVSMLASKLQDHCFAEDQAENYQKGRYWVVDDVTSLDLPGCLVEILEQMQVKASIVVPLLKGDVLWGLFSIHQCQHPRKWQESDVQFAHRIGAQLNLALQQADYLTQVQEKTQKLKETAAREKASKEKLQAQVIQLLKAVAPALEGDLTVRVPVNDSEVGTIASAYNNTLQSLQKIVLQVQAAADEVSETSKLSETSVLAVTQQAQRQAETISEALSRVQSMVSSTEAVAQGAQQVEVAAQQANQVVQRGDSAMNLTVDGIMAIRSTVAETNKHIKRLSESSQKVSKIVSLISHFTTQTQLLALNASIEATRAGEYGRGFAVVADEVRSLARQSAAAATEIEQFVKEIQSGTAEVSSAMETGIQQVAEGTALVTDARQNLTAIVEATGQISQLIADITQTTYTQADEFKAVTQTMTAATDIANQTSESSKALSSSIQQVLTTAEALQVSAAQFKSQ